MVSHPATKPLRAGAFLKIPELWVLDIPRHRLTFHHLATKRPVEGDLIAPASRSRAFPFLTSSEVLERLDDPETGAIAFHENCRAWARRVLVPRLRAEDGEGLMSRRPTPIYLDHNATTPLDPEVLEAMRPHWLAGGNPESRHSAGRGARRALERSRESVARILGAAPEEVVFTSGGTEANNLAIFGLIGQDSGLRTRDPGTPEDHLQPDRASGGGIRIEVVAKLEADGFAVDRPGVDFEGRADAGADGRGDPARDPIGDA